MVIKGNRINQKLEEQTHLTLYFPNGQVRRVPFFENPQISESKRANYIKYAPAGRSSPMYSYFNSESRMFELSFTINMDHVLDMVSKDLMSLTFPLDTFVLEGLTRESFLRKLPINPNRVSNSKTNALSYDLNYSNNILNRSDLDTTNINIFQVAQDFVNSRNGRNLKNKIVDFMLYWMNLIRSTCLNNAEDPKLGPPIVRLNHGILYKDVPCVCVSYKIDHESDAGFDRNTLMPRLISVSMSLMEVRHGDFTRYEFSKSEKRDNVVGWEAIVSPNGSMTIDPVPIYRGV